MAAVASTVAASESSEAIVSRIYEEELSKLVQQAKQSGNVAEFQLYQVSTLSTHIISQPHSINSLLLLCLDIAIILRVNVLQFKSVRSLVSIMCLVYVRC